MQSREHNSGEKETVIRAQSMLEELIHDVDAQAALLVSRTGIKIAHAGSLEDINLHSVSAVVAGAFTGLQKVAEMLGDSGVAVALQQGDQWHLQSMKINDQAILTVIFSDTGRIGRVRLGMTRVSERLRTYLEKVQRPMKAMDLPIGGDFGPLALDLIDEKLSI